MLLRWRRCERQSAASLPSLAVITPDNVPPARTGPAHARQQKHLNDPGTPDPARQLVSGLLFVVVFGLLLQKGGVARCGMLMGQCFLTDFIVIKLMRTVIIVGMVGIFSLRAPGQGDRDAIAGIPRLMAGSYVHDET